MKGFRPITVDDVRYRWRVDGENRTADIEVYLDGERGRRGQRLCLYLSGPAPAEAVHSEKCHPEGPVLPALVAAIIRDAIAKGWQPDCAGGDFKLCWFSRNLLSLEGPPPQL